MAVLTGPEIIRQVGLGDIVIKPFDPQFVGTNSVDLHMGDKLLQYALDRGAPLDSRNPPPTVEVPPQSSGGWLLLPGTLYLGVTVEYTETRGFVPMVHGRSSVGRLGLWVHVTAGLGDNGFCGNWTMELVATHPTIIYPGQRLFQVTYETLVGEQTFYGKTGNTSGRYQGDTTPTAIKVDLPFGLTHEVAHANQDAVLMGDLLALSDETRENIKAFVNWRSMASSHTGEELVWVVYKTLEERPPSLPERHHETWKVLESLEGHEALGLIKEALVRLEHY